ncbi:hypothetical protein BafHLJ01_0568 [Borreliella afzelii HLJ01]|nr:hypothetical protein BafHLJ01_0568 [Borreliella afzelii HLJ01]
MLFNMFKDKKITIQKVIEFQSHNVVYSEKL